MVLNAMASLSTERSEYIFLIDESFEFLWLYGFWWDWCVSLKYLFKTILQNNHPKRWLAPCLITNLLPNFLHVYVVASYDAILFFLLWWFPCYMDGRRVDRVHLHILRLTRHCKRTGNTLNTEPKTNKTRPKCPISNYGLRAKFYE